VKHFAKVTSGILMALGIAACGGSGSTGELSVGRTSEAVGLAIGGDAGCAGVGSVFCLNGGHWDPVLCRCVAPTPCGSTVCGPAQACCDEPGSNGVCEPRCVKGHVCPAIACKAPPPDAGCVDNVLCIQGDHWDSTLCKCVPDTTGCLTAADCHGALPDYCLVCSDGSAGCAHWSCVLGQCEIATCN
jgi:hypothetical protein